MHDHMVRAEAVMTSGAGWPAPRVALPDDIPALVAVTNLAYRVEEFFIIGTRTTEAEARARMSRAGSWFLVVDHPDEKGRIAGSVYMDIAGGRGHFAMLAVDPAHQGTGLARVLIEAVEERCRAAGCRSLDLDVVNLRTELPAFYARFGFVPTGETEPLHDQEKLKIPAHVVKMRKEI
jgi:GNAT superfamily N-acetyltransferase